MGRTWSAVFTSQYLVIPLPLVLCLLLGHARAAHSEEQPPGASTPCIDVKKLPAGQCMSFTVVEQRYVLCNGPFSLCTTANCTQVPVPSGQGAQAQCACDLVQTGLSIRTQFVDQGALRTLSNFASAAGLEVKKCPQAPLVNCLDASCTIAADGTTSSCLCALSQPPSGQIILQPVGVDVSCSVLRSGAPNDQATKLLDQAFQAAQNCTRP